LCLNATKCGTFHKVPHFTGISFLRYKKDCVVLLVNACKETTDFLSKQAKKNVIQPFFVDFNVCIVKNTDILQNRENYLKI
jgi:hypothetical protein